MSYTIGIIFLRNCVRWGAQKTEPQGDKRVFFHK